MTGAEMLQEILDSVKKIQNTIDVLQSSVSLIETNMKMLNNKASILSKEAIQQERAHLPNINPVSSVRGRQLSNELPTQINGQSAVLPEDKPGVLTYKKVFGKLINNHEEPIENVLVKIYDKNNEVCATAETDAVGYFETMLKVGRFVAEYTKDGFKTSNKTFEVAPNIKEVEIK